MNQAVNGPFGRPPVTSCAQRIYAPDGHGGGFGPSRVGLANIGPQGGGAHCTEFDKPAGHSLRLAFGVGPDNKLADFFMNAADLNGNTQAKYTVCITSDVDGHVILANYSGRDTGTDQPHGWYVAEGNKHNGVTLHLPVGMYYYWIDTEDGSEAKIPVWHQGSNRTV